MEPGCKKKRSLLAKISLTIKKQGLPKNPRSDFTLPFATTIISYLMNMQEIDDVLFQSDWT